MMTLEGQPPIISEAYQSFGVSCRVCGQGTLQKKKTFRMSMPVVVLGFLLLIPSALGMLFGVLFWFGMIDGANQASAQGEAHVAAAVAAISTGFSLFVIVTSFIGGLLGWILVMRKKVLQCSRCEAVVAAS